MKLESLFFFYQYSSLVFSLAFVLILILTSGLSLSFFRKSFLSFFARFIFLLGACSSFFYFLSVPEKISIRTVSAQNFSEPLSVAKDVFSESVVVERLLREDLGINILVFIYFFLLLGFCFYLFKYSLDLFRLRKLLRESFSVRKIFSVEIKVSETISVPLSFLFFRKAYVILPSSLLEQKKNFEIALFHELQHHRQKDTFWVHLHFFMKALFFWNPLAYLALGRLEFLQELACDEALLGQKKTSRHEYACCLWEVARKNLAQEKKLVGTTGILGLGSRFELKKRILSMNDLCRKKVLLQRVLTLVLCFCFPLTALSLKTFSGESSLNLDDGKKLLKDVKISKDFPLELNDAVLEKLNIFLKTKEGETFVEKALKEKKKYEKDFLKVFKTYGVPKELLAVAFIESGFMNLPQQKKGMLSAGIWQFIPSTAKNFGLVVTDKKDERLDVMKETDAAVRLLLSLKLRFGDWRLALLAYNGGAGRIQEGMNHLKTRDPWKLAENGYRGDGGYLAKVIAGAWILKLKEKS